MAPLVLVFVIPTIQDDESFKLTLAPQEKFDGRIFLINDWDGGDADNQNAGVELNRNSPIKNDVTILSYFPGQDPKKVDVDDLVKDAQILADASKSGKIAIAMGAHSRHVLAWLTKLPPSAYSYENISVVTHSNWNELDGRKGYEANKQPGDPPLQDTHGIALRRGLYPNLAKINDLGVTILEIPRTNSGPGGWGGSVAKSSGESAGIKAFDISDLGLVHYLKTGIVAATQLQRNQFVSEAQQKPSSLDQVDRKTITTNWEKNRDVPGEKEDYLTGGKFHEQKPGLEPAPSDPETWQVVFKDEFESRTNLGDGYIHKIDGQPGFVVNEGVLNGRQVKSNHGAVLRRELDFSDMQFDFDFRFIKESGYDRFNVVFDDSNEPTVHAGHISRISVSRAAIILQDDTGFYNKEVRTLRKLETPTAQQTAEIARRLEGKSQEVPVELRDDKWHHLRITVNVTVMTVVLDEKEIGALDSPGINHPTRNRYGFTVAGNSGIQLDNWTVLLPKK